LKTSIHPVAGNWHQGLVLDKHTVSSTFTGHSESGRPQFETIRTEVGEATFQLKYRSDWSKVQVLAQQLADSIYPQLSNVGFVVPMPASNPRTRQPVTEVARALAGLAHVPIFENLLLKTHNGQSLKDLNTKEEKVAALAGSFSLNDEISNDGKWNVLLIDDLFHTGASAEAACAVLASYRKVDRIYFAALTWR
jgi:predicted amidophosphoribosyltransferase